MFAGLREERRFSERRGLLTLRCSPPISDSSDGKDWPAESLGTTVRKSALTTAQSHDRITAMQTPQQKVQHGIELIEKGILDFLRQRGEWVYNSDIQDSLGLRFGYRAGHKGWVCGSILQRLQARGLVEKGKGKRNELWYRLSATKSK